MSELNYDIYTFLTKFIDQPGDLQNFCSQSKYFHQLCKENKNSIAKHFLEKYQVNYKNPNDFIYKCNSVKMEDYIVNSKWLYQSIFKLYMKNFYKKKIECENKKISSFPVYPNMKEFWGNYNQLTTFPIQPEMTKFYGRDNQLTIFPVQPKMTRFYCHNNKLTYVPIQPKMEMFEGENNKLTNFEVQPNMKEFEGNDNQLITFPIQPKMTTFYANRNRIISFPKQPKMIDCKANDNPIQLQRCDG
jgi:hypothetical protein